MRESKYDPYMVIIMRIFPVCFESSSGNDAAKIRCDMDTDRLFLIGYIDKNTTTTTTTVGSLNDVQ